MRLCVSPFGLRLPDILCKWFRVSLWWRVSVAAVPWQSRSRFSDRSSGYRGGARGGGDAVTGGR